MMFYPSTDVRPCPPPRTPEIALCLLNYSFTAADDASLYPPIQYAAHSIVNSISSQLIPGAADC